MSHTHSSLAPVFNADRPLSLCRILDAQAEKIPDAPAILAPGHPPLTYRRLRDHVRDVMGILNATGLGRNERIAVVLPNGPELAVSCLAVAASTTCAPLNPAYSEREFEYYFDALRPDAVIVPAGIDLPARTVAQAKGIRTIELSPHSENVAGLFVLTTLPQARPALDGFARPDDLALLLHTSGTTSRPKIVPLTHINVCTKAYDLQVAHELCEADRCLNIMPLFHASGLIGSVLPSLVAGASIVCTPLSDATKFFEWVMSSTPLGTPGHRPCIKRSWWRRRAIGD